MEYTNSRLREIVGDYVHDERARVILLRKYADNATLERIAEEQELSVSQVKRIIKKHYYQVFRHFDEK
ncbi:MAG: hypothetical protein J6U01_08160 [Clostridia bacterium]|nr:hypothetical protein [Clostridia bacterium]